MDANSSITGMRLQQSASSVNDHGMLTLSGGGTGIHLNNSSHHQLNGLIDMTGGTDVIAVNGAYAYFNGTSWAGSPNTWADGSSTIIINNPNNPLGSPDPAFALMAAQGEPAAISREQEEAGLLQQWAMRYRERPESAVEWLNGLLNELSAQDYTQAVILLSDYYLSRGVYDQVLTLTESLRGNPAEPEAGALALRRLQLALFGQRDAHQAWHELSLLEAAGFDRYLTERFASMIRLHLGEDERQSAAKLTSAGEASDLPSTYSLEQNYPNPFNPTTNISYSLPELTDVRLEVFNMLGQRVATLVNTTQNAGSYTISFDAGTLSSGLYLYRLQAGSFVQTQKMMLVK